MSGSCTSKPPQTERTSFFGTSSVAGSQQPNEAQILFLLQNRARFSRKLRRNNYFAENFADRFGERLIDLAIANDDAAKGRLLVRGKCFLPSLAKIGIAPDPARVGMLQDCNRRFLKFADQTSRRADVENVVKGKFLAVQFFKVLDRNRRRAPLSDADFRRNANASPAASSVKTRHQLFAPCSEMCRWRDRRQKS